jgi:cell shape-determining protein MreD
LHRWLGTPFNVVPALLVYAALTHGLWLTTVFSAVAALWIDSISASTFGVSLMPMFLYSFMVQTRGHLILREQRYAQFWLGLAGGVLVPLATAGMLQLGRREPAFTLGTLWQLLVLGLLNAILCPGVFHFFDQLNQAFNYQSLEPQAFRIDRQMVRGRH